MEKKKKVIFLRVNEKEFEIINEKFMQSCQKSMNKFAINSIINSKITSQEELNLTMDINIRLSELNRLLRGACTNLNQLTKIANSTGDFNRENVENYAKEIKQNLSEVNEIWQLTRSLQAMLIQGEQYVTA